jgi:hypothetical protein
LKTSERRRKKKKDPSSPRRDARQEGVAVTNPKNAHEFKSHAWTAIGEDDRIAPELEMMDG